MYVLPLDLAAVVLEAHLAQVKTIEPSKELKLELQLGYSGLMAKGAYKGWKRPKHFERRKVGCFDFKIFRIDGNELLPLVHTRVIDDAGQVLTKRIVEEVFSGKDPQCLGLSEGLCTVAQEVQLAMLEQEINWGDEQFQSWTYFAPSKGKRPRDYISAYLRRSFVEPEFLYGVDRMRAASGTRGVLPPPKPGKEWNPYLEPSASTLKPWLAGGLLKRYRDVADSMPDNPQFKDEYGQQSQ
jgi:hypothetical protein